MWKVTEEKEGYVWTYKVSDRKVENFVYFHHPDSSPSAHMSYAKWEVVRGTKKLTAQKYPLKNNELLILFDEKMGLTAEESKAKMLWNKVKEEQ